MSDSQNVAVLGASTDPERYSHKALVMLRRHGHRVYPVHPTLEEVEGVPVYASLGDLPDPIDTLTVYLGPARFRGLIEDVTALAPGRVLLNPGTEDDEIEDRLAAAGIPYEKACTLVLLSTGQF